MPDWNEAIRERLRGLNLDGAREAEIVEELAQHLGDRYAELIGGGATAGSHGGYGAYAAWTARHTFGLKLGTIFWCTADFGWITGWMRNIQNHTNIF